jgi:hypothetical protein
MEKNFRTIYKLYFLKVKQVIKLKYHVKLSQKKLINDLCTLP